MNKPRVTSLVCTWLFSVIVSASAESDVVFSSPVVNGSPIYSCSVECADDFVLQADAAITRIHVWGGYGTASVPSQQAFSVGIFEDTGSGLPQETPMFSAANIVTTPIPTTFYFLTDPNNAVYRFELLLPRSVNLQANRRYYLALSPSDIWAWSSDWPGSGPSTTSEGPWYRLSLSEGWFAKSTAPFVNFAFELHTSTIPEEVPGDLDGDAVIDETDFTVFLTTFGLCEGVGGFNAEADYDTDGCITFVDYQAWYGFYLNQ